MVAIHLGLVSPPFVQSLRPTPLFEVHQLVVKRVPQLVGGSPCFRLDGVNRHDSEAASVDFVLFLYDVVDCLIVGGGDFL